jgi:hypothetical protein
MVREHMFPYSVQKQELTDRIVRRLATRLEPAKIEELVWLIEADWGAREDGSMKFEQADELLTRAEKLGVKDGRPKALVTGQDLLALGMKQGRDLGEKLKMLYEAQLDGEFESREEGIKYLKERLK